jgi:glycosyltransferase involved in cell wall biosynthesis
MKIKESISFFCPAYNDELNITKVVTNADKMLRESTDKYEIIVVEDGGPDKTYEVLKKLKKTFPHLKIIHHKQNMGYGAALKDGFENSKYDWVIYTDGDFQYNPYEFKRFLKYTKYYDVIIGYKIKRNDSPHRYIQSRIFNLAVRILFGLNCKDANCSMKIIKNKYLKQIKIDTNTAFIDVEILAKLKKFNLKMKEVPVHHYARLHGEAGGIKLKVIIPTITDMLKFFIKRS